MSIRAKVRVTDESERTPPRRGPGGADGAVRSDRASTSPSTAVVETLAVAVDRAETTLDSLRWWRVSPNAFTGKCPETNQKARSDSQSRTAPVGDSTVRNGRAERCCLPSPFSTVVGGVAGASLAAYRSGADG
jgi:flavin-binding protein dodecin